MNGSSQFRPAGSLAIATALNPYNGPWDRRKAAHLLRRAGFGGSPADLDRLSRMSMNDAVDSLVHYPKDSGLPGTPSDMTDVSVQEFMLNQAVRNGGVDQQSAQMQRMELNKQRRAAVVSMQQWWLGRMIKSPAPLQEKMALFWHGHFANAVIEKGITPKDSIDQNWLFRDDALGNVREMTLAISRDPSMLKYLDNRSNIRAHPNENYARELMELFTLGIGNYTEHDIRESARAFTGWSILGPLRGGTFIFNERQHDYGTKTFLGQTGQFDGADIVRIIFEQPAAPRWFARKLLNFFVYSDPEPQLIDAFAAQIKRNDFQIWPAMSMLLRSNVFYSDRAYRALVKSPVEFAVGAHQLLGIDDVTPETLAALTRMGQVLFYPPNVKGWDGGMTWLNSQTVLARENFANYLVTSQMMQQANGGSWMMDGPPPSAEVAARRLTETILQGDASPAAIAQLQSFLDGAGTAALPQLSGENFQERMRGAAYLTMAMPAYQLS